MKNAAWHQIDAKALPIVNTGPGKGKSTAAFGLMLRALGQGWRVGVVRFIKGAWNTGERQMLERFPDQVRWHARRGFHVDHAGQGA